MLLSFLLVILFNSQLSCFLLSIEFLFLVAITIRMMAMKVILWHKLSRTCSPVGAHTQSRLSFSFLLMRWLIQSMISFVSPKWRRSCHSQIVALIVFLLFWELVPKRETKMRKEGLVIALIVRLRRKCESAGKGRRNMKQILVLWLVIIFAHFTAVVCKWQHVSNSVIKLSKVKE